MTVYELEVMARVILLPLRCHYLVSIIPSFFKPSHQEQQVLFDQTPLTCQQWEGKTKSQLI